MPGPLQRRLSELPRLSKTALCELWKELFDSSPSPQLRRKLMISILAYRIQEQAFGALSSVARTKLRQLGRSLASNPGPTGPFLNALKPGTRLVRQWQDQVHLVNVEAEGYEYQGVRYRSLSEIARVITGTQWSGPAFFGINQTRTTTEGKEVQ